MSAVSPGITGVDPGRVQPALLATVPHLLVVGTPRSGTTLVQRLLSEMAPRVAEGPWPGLQPAAKLGGPPDQRAPRRAPMPPFRNILFLSLAGRGQSAALNRLEPMLEPDVRLTVLGVVPAPSAWQKLRAHGSFLDEAQEALHRAEHQRLARLAGRVRVADGHVNQPGIAVEVAVDAGNAAVTVIERVMGDGHDLVAVSGEVDVHDGALLRRLLRKCPCPVWVIRPTRARTERVVAAVNASPDEEDLNLQILGLARWMHQLRGGELHMVHAWELFGEDTYRRSGYLKMAEEKIEVMATEERSHHQEAVDRLLAHPLLDGAPWQTHIDKGQPADVVVDAVQHQHATLLVLGTVARSGLSGLVMGNTAEVILDRVSCSVMAIKPHGFRSPVADHLSADSGGH